jgi:hypothetical protein
MRPRPQSATLASRAARELNQASAVTLTSTPGGVQKSGSSSLLVKQPVAPSTVRSGAQKPSILHSSRPSAVPSSASMAARPATKDSKPCSTPTPAPSSRDEELRAERRAMVTQFLESNKRDPAATGAASPGPSSSLVVLPSSPSTSDSLLAVRRTSPPGSRGVPSFRTYGVVPRDASAARHLDTASEPHLPPPPAIIELPAKRSSVADVGTDNEMNTSMESGSGCDTPRLLPTATAVLSEWPDCMERRNTGRYVQHFSTMGFYKCARCQTPLFSAKAKLRGVSGGFAAFKSHYVPSLALEVGIHSASAMMLLAVQAAPTLSLRCTGCKLFVGTAPLEKQHDANDIIFANSCALQFVDQAPPPAFVAVEGSLLNHGGEFDDEDDDGRQTRPALRRASQVPSFSGLLRRGRSNTSPRQMETAADSDDNEDAADGQLWLEMRSARRQ